jgi:hypothetical protein
MSTSRLMLMLLLPQLKPPPQLLMAQAPNAMPAPHAMPAAIA